jgi:hypothetical protein
MKNDTRGLRGWAVLTVVLCISGNLLAYSGDGDGSSGSPYQISSVADWQDLMAVPADWSSYFILTADVNLAGVTLTPVGNDGNRFTGVFDGNDNIISNADINQRNSNYVGLFGYVGSGGKIRNLGVEDVNITGQFSIGGLVGVNSGTLTACYATGSVSGGGSTGGLVGYNEGGTLISCYATGSVSRGGSTGGLVGYNIGSTLISCYAAGSVDGSVYVGGLVGANLYSTLTDCYATGSVGGSSYVGGLVGYNESGMLTACFWDIQTSGQTTSDGGTGKTTAEMKTLSTFTSAGWDFVDAWGIGNGQTYPYLKPFNGINPADINYSGTVDFKDFAIIAENWLEGI